MREVLQALRALSAILRRVPWLEGKGDGAVAPAPGERPIDLAQIAKQNGGTFPFDRTVQAIDGTMSVRAHGVSEMPVWGETFRAQPGWSARGKIVLITEYLRSIQAR
jgi:hypothetical protein